VSAVRALRLISKMHSVPATRHCEPLVLALADFILYGDDSVRSKVCGVEVTENMKPSVGRRDE